MKYTYKILPEMNLLRETWQGTITRDDMVRAITRQKEDPAWTQHMNVIADFTAARSELSAEEMWEYAKWVIVEDTTNQLAIVVGRSFDFGMSRMFQMLTDKGHFRECRVFYDLTEAENWIKSHGVD